NNCINCLNCSIYPNNNNKGIEFIKILLQHGADPNIQDKKGNTVLYYACVKYKHRIIKLLLDYGVNVNTKNNMHQTILTYICNFEKYDYSIVVKLLLDNNTNPNIG